VRRYQCRLCGRQFSSQTFSIDYYAKRRVDYRRLEQELASSCGIRALGRLLRVGRKTVENKLMRLARQALAAQTAFNRTIDPCEDLVADGFQSFWVSQYFPNNLHLLVGAHSQWAYAWNGLTLRRGGRMSEEQKRRRQALERRWDRGHERTHHSFAELIDYGCTILNRAVAVPLTLRTDEHPAYPRALRANGSWRRLADAGRVAHRRYSSELPRTRGNPLFAVNYLDRELRKDLAEHVRESTRFARAAHTSMERLSVYLVHHNTEKPFRINQPTGSVDTHASQAGVPAAAVRAVKDRGGGWYYRSRAFFSRLRPHGTFLRIWLRMYRTPLRSRPAYLPQYMLA
jgi:hypothetical protein